MPQAELDSKYLKAIRKLTQEGPSLKTGKKYSYLEEVRTPEAVHVPIDAVLQNR